MRCLVSPNEVHSFRLADGSSFYYPLNSAIGYALYTGQFEKAVIEFVRRELKPGGNFLDVGANGGVYTVVAARSVGPTGHVYAFEPGDREAKLLRENVLRNGLTNVTVIDSAVSNKKGIAQFAISRDGAMNSLARNRHPGQEIESWKTVNTTTLDSAVEEYGISNVDLIKVDVEGAEQLVLEGAQALLSASPTPTIICEFCDLTAAGFGTTASALWGKFEQFGYHLFSLSDSQPLTLRPAVRADCYPAVTNLVAIARVEPTPSPNRGYPLYALPRVD